MATDVRLDDGDGTFLTLDARVVKVVGSDFMLDSPGRRIGSKPFRRALVHDQADGLTVNFANDYKGGVTLNAVREISPLQVQAPTGSIDPTPRLVVRGGIEFEVHSTATRVGGGSGVEVTTLSLIGELTKLQDQITELQTRVAALEAR